jgi:hypothetical protein
MADMDLIIKTPDPLNFSMPSCALALPPTNRVKSFQLSWLSKKS